MAITAAFTNQAKQDFLNGVHQPADVYKMALYTNAASLDKNTTTYSATNEVAAGLGYSTGGATLTGFTVALSSDTAYIDFADPTWAAATFVCRGAVIYNSTRSNKVLAVLDFGADRTGQGGTFTAEMPAPGTSAIIRIA